MEMTAGAIELEFNDSAATSGSPIEPAKTDAGGELVLRGKVNAAVKQAQGLAIKTVEDCQKAQIILKGAKKLQKEIKESFSNSVAKAKKSKEAATEAYKAVCEHQKEFLGPLELLEASLKTAIDAWTANMERLKAIEERKRADEAAKLQEQAQTAMASGDADKALELSTQAAMATAATPAVQTSKVEGVYTQTRWTFEIVDARLIPRDYLKIDEPKLAELATRCRDSVTVPGVRFFAKTSTAVKA